MTPMTVLVIALGYHDLLDFLYVSRALTRKFRRVLERMCDQEQKAQRVGLRPPSLNRDQRVARTHRFQGPGRHHKGQRRRAHRRSLLDDLRDDAARERNAANASTGRAQKVICF